MGLSQNKDLINSKIELAIGVSTSINKSSYENFYYGNNKKIQLPVVLGYNKDAFHFALSKNIAITKRLLVTPSIEFNYVKDNNFELQSETVQKDVFSVPVLLAVKYQVILKNKCRHYLLAGAGNNFLNLNIQDKYHEKGNPFYRFGYSFISEGRKIGIGFNMDFCSYKTTQFITYLNQQYYFNYTLKRHLFNICLLHRI